jgi:hypothetical protein
LSKAKVLEKAGISTQQASEWERPGDVPDDKFEGAAAIRSLNVPRPDLTDSERRAHSLHGKANSASHLRCRAGHAICGGMKTNLTIRIDPDIESRLAKLAMDEDRSLSVGSVKGRIEQKIAR